MKFNINRLTLISGVLFLAILAISLVLYILMDNNKARRVLLFPEIKSMKLSGEVRYLPKQIDMENDAKFLLEELRLGPSRENHLRLLSKNVKILSVIERKKSLYVNMSDDILRDTTRNKLGFKETFEALTDNVIFNFPVIKSVYFFIDGQLPKGSDFEKGLTFSRKLLK